jgi:hypothetical protein
MINGTVRPSGLRNPEEDPILKYSALLRNRKSTTISRLNLGISPTPNFANPSPARICKCDADGPVIRQSNILHTRLWGIT